MPLANYGVLKGTVIGHLRDADDDHYQILLRAGQKLHRVAVNVKSQSANAPSTLRFQSKTGLPTAWTQGLAALGPGWRKLPSRSGGLALDYQRSGIVNPVGMKLVPPSLPGADNDLKDLVEAAVLRAIKEPGALMYALGAAWGPEAKRADQYFKFLPGSGVHDIHMNQGNHPPYTADNGTWQDGALVFSYPAGTWRAFFFAFQSQRLPTDARGQPQA